MSKLLDRIRRTKPTRVPGCVEASCRSDMIHRRCADCGVLTCVRQMRVNPKTLRRQLVGVCNDCYLRSMFDPAQERLKAKRTRDDWEKVTDPILAGAIRPDEMPEQLPGATRMALRAFQRSEATTAVVPDLAAETLNQSIASLGLAGVMYAETRGKQTVLRKVA